MQEREVITVILVISKHTTLAREGVEGRGKNRLSSRMLFSTPELFSFARTTSGKRSL